MSEAIRDMILDDPMILWMVVLSLLLALLSVAVVIVTLRYRIVNMQKQAHWRKLESTWTPLMIQVLSGGIPPSHLLSLLAAKDHFSFIDFLLRYASRFDDHERHLVEQMAAPFLHRIRDRTEYRDPHIRARAIMTLGLLGASRYTNVLIDALEADEPLIVLAASRSLAGLQDERLLRPVLANIHKVENWSINYLSRVIASAGPAASRPCREILESEESSPWLQILAAETLRRSYDFSAADLARDLILARPDMPRGVICACLRMLRELGTERHLDAIRHYWGASDSSVRLNAVTALGIAGTSHDLPRLRLMLHDDNQWVVWAAARGLALMGDRSFLQDIITSGHAAASAAQAVLEEAADGIDMPLQLGVS